MPKGAFRASDHYDKWANMDQRMKDENAQEEAFREFYDDHMRNQRGQGAKVKSKFNDFKQNRHKIKTDAERRAEREAKYGKYEPKEDSAFHENNRKVKNEKGKGFYDKTYAQVNDMFKIRRGN